MANGLHKVGDNGMLFEEWCEEHSYLRRSHGCNGSTSPVVCDMALLQQFSSDPNHVALVHISDSGNGKVPIAMSSSGVLKLAAFLWVKIILLYRQLQSTAAQIHTQQSL